MWLQFSKKVADGSERKFAVTESKFLPRCQNPQLSCAGDIRQMHIKVHIFGIVDNLADIVKITLRACQGGVQLRKFGGVQLFQSCGKEEVYLSTNEFEVLYLLLQSPQTTFTKEQIYEQIWHEPTNNHLHAVENTIFQIRKRLKPYCKGHEYIKTVIGYGYKFNSE